MAVLTIDIGLDEYTDLLNDIVKYTTILLVVQFMMFAEYGGKSLGKIGFLKRSIYNKHFINLLLYVLVGVATYELIVRKLVVFA